MAQLAHPPAVAAPPLIGSNLKLLYDPLSYLVQQYQQLGPVFRMQMGFTHYTVMAGIEANHFLATEGERVFGSESLFGGLAREMNTETMLVALDGPDHKHMRRLLRPGYARSAAHPHLDALLDVVARYVDAWPQGGTIPVFEQMRRIVVDQIGLITTGFVAEEYFEDILVVINTLLNVEVLKIWPRVMLRRPRYRQARRCVLAFGRQILQAHQHGEHNDMVSHIINGTRPDGQPFNESDLVSMIVGTFFAGMDTIASTMAFFMYTVHKYPEILQAVQAEARALFAEGTPDIAAFDKNLPTLRAAMLETLRRYPVTPFTPRVVSEPFDFAGYHFAPGTDVMLAQTVTHLLPEYYPAPERFDISRHLKGDAPPLHVFAPYSLGNHTCLGAGLAERQMLITMAALLNRVELALAPPDYEITIHTMPLPNPGPRFALRVVRHL